MRCEPSQGKQETSNRPIVSMIFPRFAVNKNLFRSQGGGGAGGAAPPYLVSVAINCLNP